MREPWIPGKPTWRIVGRRVECARCGACLLEAAFDKRTLEPTGTMWVRWHSARPHVVSWDEGLPVVHWEVRCRGCSRRIYLEGTDVPVIESALRAPLPYLLRQRPNLKRRPS